MVAGVRVFTIDDNILVRVANISRPLVFWPRELGDGNLN